MFRRTLVIVAVSVAGLVTPAASEAQSWLPAHATAQVSGGYALLRDSATEQTLPRGWFGGGTMALGPRVSVAVEIGGAYKTYASGPFTLQRRVHAFLGGVRVSGRPLRRMTPFGALLVGTGCYCGSSEHPDGFQVGLAIQAGGGVDVSVASRLAMRVQGDVRHVRDAGVSFHQWRLAAGPVLQVWQR